MESRVEVTFQGRELTILVAALEYYATKLEEYVATGIAIPGRTSFNPIDTEREFAAEHARTLASRIQHVVEANGV